jgi:hypothetical protein
MGAMPIQEISMIPPVTQTCLMVTLALELTSSTTKTFSQTISTCLKHQVSLLTNVDLSDQLQVTMRLAFREQLQKILKDWLVKE